ncbi:MAG TPA: tetratricopeptide repeat protein, partial [Nitrospirota bacterium]
MSFLARRPWTRIFLIVGLGVLAYANTFHAPFFFDDEPSIVFNPVVKDPGNFLSSPLGYEYAPRRFIGYLTFALNYKLGGLEVTGYHIFNLAVHIVNALLLYALLVLTFRTPALKGRSAPFTPELTALCAAVLFVVHPLQTQAVTYIVQRLASLATLFYLLALYLYARARLLREPGRPVGGKAVSLYVLSFASTVLAMKTKEIAFTLPLAVALYEFFFLRAALRTRLFVLAPMLLMLLIIPASMLNINQPVGAVLSDVSDVTRVQSLVSRRDYLLTEFGVISAYVRLLLLPVNQNVDYDYPIAHSLFSPAVFFSFLFLLALFALAVFLAARSRREDAADKSAYRLVSFGIFWFFLTLSVESSIIPIEDVIFEHRAYLPSAGFFIALTAGAGIVSRRLETKKIDAAKSLAALFAAAALALTAATFSRNTLWRDNLLWADSAEKSPGKARPHYNAANVYVDEGRLEDAVREYQAALRLKPDYAEAHSNLGIAYGKQGRVEEAVREFRIALDIGLKGPKANKAYNNLGVAYATQGRYEEAILRFQQALRLDPANAEAHKNLGLAYSRLGRQEEALKEIQAAITLDPG